MIEKKNSVTKTRKINTLIQIQQKKTIKIQLNKLNFKSTTFKNVDKFYLDLVYLMVIHPFEFHL